MDEVDEWFYDSIQRYNKLQMFTLNENVNHIEFSPNKNNIVVSNINTSTKRCQILEYALPSKFLDTSDALCNTDHNLKIVCGTYVNQLVLEIKALMSSNCIVTSEKHQTGVNVYSFPTNDTDKITETDTISSDYKEPHISTHFQAEHLLCMSHSTTHPLSVVDINSKSQVHEIQIDWDSSLKSPLRTAFLDVNTLCVCFQQSGLVRLYDLRCPDQVLSSLVKDETRVRGHWTMSLSHSSSTLNLLSSQAFVQMLDVRNLSEPSFETKLPIKIKEYNTNKWEELPQIETCPQDSQRFSVSGFNENVHIFERREGELCDEVFTHDAHSYQEQCDKNTRVVCHRWMSDPHERMMLSSADNASFTCIQYNSKL